jgi:hypothetical protein
MKYLYYDASYIRQRIILNFYLLLARESALLSEKKNSSLKGKEE